MFPIDTNYLGVGGGGLWATDGDRGLVKIDPSDGRVIHRVHFAGPCGLVVADHGVWVFSCQGPDSGGDVLMKIDPDSARVLYRVPLPKRGPVSAAFADGRLWLALWAGDHVQIGARDPATGRLTGSVFRVGPGSQPWSPIGGIGPPVVFIAVGADSFWLTHVDEADVVRVGLTKRAE
jgi:hypothetical protein